MPAPPPPTTAVISSTTALMLVNTGQSNTVILDSNTTASLTNTEGRLLMIKATSDSGPSINTAALLCSNGTSFYPGSSNASLQAYYCATLMENPANIYNIITYYQGTFTDYVTGPDPGTTIVNVSGSNSMLFLDLKTVSKVFVLPSIDSLAASETESPSFIFKDVYGTIATNTWYISTSGTRDSFEGLGTTLRFTTPNAAIQIVGKKGNRDNSYSNYWYILGGYGI